MTFVNTLLQTTTRPNSGNTRERRRSNLADIQVRTKLLSFWSSLFLFLVLVLVLVFDLVLVLDMLNLKIFSQSDGSLSSSSETLLRVVEEGSKVGEFKLIRIEKFHLEKKRTAWSCWSYLITSNPQPEGAPKEKNGVGLIAVMTVMAIRKP